jgi:hypothetical protein
MQASTAETTQSVAGEEAGVNLSVTTHAQVESRTSLTTNGTAAMAIVPLPLPPDVEARVLLHHLLEHGDIVGGDTAGRTIIQLAVDDWVYEKLMTFDDEAAELEDGGDAEPDDDAEESWLPVVLLDVVRPKVITQRSTSSRCSLAITS